MANETVSIKRGLSTALPTSKTAGQILVTTDTGEMYVDDSTTSRVQIKDTTKLPLSGGTMTGSLNMGSNPITTTYTPTEDSDVVNKAYVDDSIITYTGTNPIVVSGSTISHASYTARSGGPSESTTLTYGGTFSVPYVTSDSTGHVTGVTSRTMTMPAAVTSVTTATNATNATYLGSATNTVGTGTNPIYLSNGQAVASTSTAGSSTLPVYLNEGTITACGTSLAVSITGTAARATADASGNTITSTYAKIASPTLTGTPAAPTAAAGTNTTQIATTAFVTTAVANAVGDITSFEYSVVTSLPTTGSQGIIYLVADSHEDSNDNYDEYIWIDDNSAYEKIGNTDMDLSSYVKVSTAGTSVGSNTQPVYINSSGVATGISNTTDATTSSASPAHGGTFTAVDSITTTNGLVTAVNTKTITLPSDNNTDTKVTQTASTAATAYPILLSASTAPAGSATTSLYVSGVTITPSTKTITATTFSGNATTATTATKLGTADVGSDGVPIYLSAGVATAVTDPTRTDTTSTASPEHSGTFTTVDSVTTDTHGRVTGVNVKTITLPEESNTDTKVTQTVTTTSAEYPILTTATSAQTTSSTNTARFASAITLNPGAGTITASSFVGALSGNATSATTATTATSATSATTASKLGSSTVGSAYQPIYLSSGSATQCTVVNNTTATAITAAASLATNNTIYYGTPTINGSHSYTSSTSIYAPTSVGTSGYILQSSGSGAPSWVDTSTLSVGSADTATSATSATSATNATNSTNVYSTLSTTTAGTYYLDFHTTASSANKELKHTANLSLVTVAGTTSTVGTETIIIGNATASGTAANATAILRMYGTGAYYGQISGQQALTANRTYYLNNAGGTLVTHATWGTAVGNTTNPVYISSTGQATALSSTVGASATPVYLSSGAITKCGYSFTDYLPLAGGTVTGEVYESSSISDSTVAFRNCVVVDAGTDPTSLDVPVGTIIMVKEE